MSGVLTRGTVTVAVERCKGCELCIPACRPGVLKMSDLVNAHGFQYPELLSGCTACRACFEVCPDFVFEVYKFDTPVELDAEAPVAPVHPASSFDATSPVDPGPVENH